MTTFEYPVKLESPLDQHRLSRQRSNLMGVLQAPKLRLPADGIFHNGLFNYLALCWRNHYSIVLKPDDFWYTILCELTEQIKAKPEAYAELFTTTPGTRQWIIVQTDDVTQIPVDSVIDRLHDCVPTDTKMFLPTFSTTTDSSRLAMNVAFCDMMSPFYGYGTQLCGFPVIQIEGELEDWSKLLTHLELLENDPFKTGPIKTYLARCWDVINMLLQAVKQGNRHFVGQIVRLDKCGSGSQYEMSGWIMGLLFKNERKVQLEGLPSHVSVMKYENLDTGRKFRLFCGLIQSDAKDAFLVPRYASYVVEGDAEHPKAPKLSDMKIVSEQTDAGGRPLAKGLVYAPYQVRYKDVPPVQKLKARWTEEPLQDLSALRGPVTPEEKAEAEEDDKK